jgi:hypothetical protein
MKLFIGITADLLQQVRLIHALTESSFEIVLPSGEIEKYLPLKKFFGMKFVEGKSGDFDLTDCLTIDHATPITAIGYLKRPVIFPHSIQNYCHSLWREKRDYRFSFAGLITDKRKVLLETWIQKNIGQQSYPISEQQNQTKKTAIEKLMGIFRFSNYPKRIKIGDLSLWSSTRGRTFPVKSWDDDYFKVLSKSKFILCPSGDYVWSYRFFETILCGAIPIIEKNCPAYAGFRFYTLNDNVKELEWRPEDVEYNFRHCSERITVPKDSLNNELIRLVGRKEA